MSSIRICRSLSQSNHRRPTGVQIGPIAHVNIFGVLFGLPIERAILPWLGRPRRTILLGSRLVDVSAHGLSGRLANGQRCRSGAACKPPCPRRRGFPRKWAVGMPGTRAKEGSGRPKRHEAIWQQLPNPPHLQCRCFGSLHMWQRRTAGGMNKAGVGMHHCITGSPLMIEPIRGPGHRLSRRKKETQVNEGPGHNLCSGNTAGTSGRVVAVASLAEPSAHGKGGEVQSRTTNHQRH